MRTSVHLYTRIIFFSLLSVSLFSCTKVNPTVNNNNVDNGSSQCQELALIKAKASVTSVVKGGTFVITADTDPDASYEWIGPGNFQSDVQTNTISYATYDNAGWYYLMATNTDGCYPAHDSVYVDVTIPQGSPSCSIANNNVSFTGVANDQDFTSSGLSYSTFEGYTLTGNSSTGDIKIILSTHWYDIEPEDGVYTTISDQGFDNGDIDNVFISDVNSDILFTVSPGLPVYVSHVGGKLQISFCSISMSGDDGSTLFTTTASGKVTVH